MAGTESPIQACPRRIQSHAMSIRKFPSLRFSEENDERLKEDFLFANRAACFGNQPQRHVPTWNLQLLDESGLGACLGGL